MVFNIVLHPFYLKKDEDGTTRRRKNEISGEEEAALISLFVFSILSLKSKSRKNKNSPLLLTHVLKTTPYKCYCLCFEKKIIYVILHMVFIALIINRIITPFTIILHFNNYFIYMKYTLSNLYTI